jgi:hypothetical protein
MGLLLNAASFQVQKGLLAPALCLPLVLIRRWRPLPSYHRTVRTALQLDTLTLARRLQLLLAPAEAPRVSREESFLPRHAHRLHPSGRPRPMGRDSVYPGARASHPRQHRTR